MDVIKRSGAVQEYDPQKITGAMRKAFASVDQACDEAALSGMLAQVERAIGDGVRTVEDIQDEVERALMAGGFQTLTAYIVALIVYQGGLLLGFV